MNIRRILRGFQAATGIKVNFSKSRLVGVGIDANVTLMCANLISCRADSFPSLYLGLPLGDKFNSVAL